MKKDCWWRGMETSTIGIKVMGRSRSSFHGCGEMAL